MSAGRAPRLTTPSSSENVDCTDAWDWRCLQEKYQSTEPSDPDNAADGDTSSPGRSIIRMTMSTSDPGATINTDSHIDPAVMGYNPSLVTAPGIPGSSGSVTGGPREGTTSNEVSVALHAALASLGVLIVLLVILIVYFGYFRKRRRGQDTDSESGSGIDNYAYAKHKRLGIPYSLQENRLSVIPELSEHDSESQYEYIDAISQTQTQLPSFLISDHSMNPGYEYSDPNAQTEILTPSANIETESCGYVDPATGHTKFPSSEDEKADSSHQAYMEIDPETNYQLSAGDSTNNTEQESSTTNVYQQMLPSNDLNQHVYASSSLPNEYEDSDNCTSANNDTSEHKVSNLTTSTAADNNVYNICEPEGVDNSTYEPVFDDEQTTNNISE